MTALTRTALLTVLALTPLFLSCSDLRNEPTRGQLQQIPAGEILVRPEASSFFPNLDGYSFEDRPATKSGEAGIPLESILDLDNRKTLSVGGCKFSETPFLSNSDPAVFHISNRMPADGEDVCADSLLVVQSFLIGREGEGIDDAYVVTLLARYSYYISHREEGLSYLVKPGFSGFAIFSDVDGTYCHVSSYCKGSLEKAEFIPREMVDDVGTKSYIIPACPISTKALTVDGGELKGSVCIGYVSDRRLSSVYTITILPGITNGESDDPAENAGRRGGGGGGNATRDTTDSGGPNLKVLNKLKSFSIENATGSDTDYVSQLYDLAFTEIASMGDEWTNGMIESLENVQITIVANGGDNTTSRRVTKDSRTYVGAAVRYQVDQLGNPKSTVEELIHAYQYQCLGDDGQWSAGDIEFEAKVCLARMMVDGYLKYEEVKAERLKIISDYLNNPTQETYSKALEAYKTLFPSYYNDYPMSKGINVADRIKHLR